VGRALHFNARHLGIALQAPRAVADGRVVLDFAERIAAANGSQARVFALLRHASLVIGTIVILETFIWAEEIWNILDESLFVLRRRNNWRHDMTVLISGNRQKKTVQHSAWCQHDDTQQDDTQQDDTQHDGPQHDDTQHDVTQQNDT
jgi:hypothetical protein